jgi:hypothetical protein
MLARRLGLTKEGFFAYPRARIEQRYLLRKTEYTMKTLNRQNLSIRFGKCLFAPQGIDWFT